MFWYHICFLHSHLDGLLVPSSPPPFWRVLQWTSKCLRLLEWSFPAEARERGVGLLNHLVPQVRCLRNVHGVLHPGVVVYIPPRCAESSFSSEFSPGFLVCSRLDRRHWKWCAVIPGCVCGWHCCHIAAWSSFSRIRCFAYRVGKKMFGLYLACGGVALFWIYSRALLLVKIFSLFLYFAS